MPSQVNRVFVYGTLKAGQANHARFCADALSVEPALTRGRLYALPAGFPAMVEHTQDVVHGEVIAFPDIGAALERLDFLEGYRPGCPDHSLYVRRIRPVTLLGSDATVLAHCYFWRGRLPAGAVLVPSGRWVPRGRGRT